MPRTFTFEAVIGRTWVLYTVEVPERVTRGLEATGKVPVVFTVNGSSPRKTTLTPRAGGGHRMHVHGESRKEVGAREGDKVSIVVWRDTGSTAVSLPRDLAAALREADALETFQTMGPSMQRELVSYVEKAKKEETRSKYVARVVERASEVREKRIDRAAREMARRATRQ